MLEAGQTFFGLIVGIAAVLSLFAGTTATQVKPHPKPVHKKKSHDMANVETFFSQLMNIVMIPVKLLFRVLRVPKRKYKDKWDKTTRVIMDEK